MTAPQGRTGPNPLFNLGGRLRHGTVSEDSRQLFLSGGRAADRFYRQRWSHDKVVRSTHGVNCTGSCSWKVYVKDGVITWETQETDYPSIGPDMPEYEPRGCPRGAAFSWYTYSPTRIRFPYIRGVLLDHYREAKERLGDPVLAWRDVVEDPERAAEYKSARGKGGLVRVGWDEAMELIAAAHVYTVKRWGPDRLAGFTVIPAMSMISYGAGSRFYELVGGTMLSFYDWYADLPMASPQVFGDQTDVPESADWFNSGYLIMWGSNIPLTRTPDAHFMTEARYHGQKVVAVSPDYADNTKFADEWLRVHPGTDGALALAMGHVILREFHLGRRTPRFLDYMARYTDAPFLVRLEDNGDGTMVPGKFVTAADLPAGEGLRDSANAEFRPLVLDADGTVKDPGGTMADRWGDAGEGRWNLNLDDCDPAMTVYGREGAEAVEVSLPRFDLPGEATAHGPVGAGVVRRGVPAMRLGDGLVTTVFDLMLANYAVGREGLPGQWPTGYDDASVPGTPAWQEELTGVPAAAAERIGREFALNAIETEGKSMIVMGAGTNHYYHSDTIYRTFLALTTMTGCQGVNGGGWAHYVGQEKVRPITGWAQYAFALDWQRPPRQMISTAFWYLTTEQWRYDGTAAERLASPLQQGSFEGLTTADTLVEATRRGWMPGFPTFDRNPLAIGAAAAEEGIPVADYVVRELEAGRLRFAVEDPGDPANFPRVIGNWRTNLLGSSAKGTEYFYRHMLGCDDAVRGEEVPEERRPKLMEWREEAAVGKVDLMWTADFRNTSTTLHSDVVLPAATWYEKNDLSSTDMHPYVHAFNAAIDPPWEARSDFAVFGELAKRFSAMARTHLGVQQDVIAAPLTHDTPDQMATPHGAVADWETGPKVPGVTMPKLIGVERDYPATWDKFSTIGPLPETAGMATKGVAFDPSREIEELARINGVARDGSTAGRPLVDTDVKAAEMVLRLSGTTNGRLATEGFRHQERRTGTELADLSAEEAGKRVTFADVSARPVPVITSPEWSGSEHGGRRYNAFVINVERSKPFHTLTGRQHYYLDHDWMRDMGESLPVFRPPLDLHHLYGEAAPGTTGVDGAGRAEVAVRYLTPHNKWAIHSQYFDNLHMLALSRGGQVVWMSPADAEKIGVADNDWVEGYNRNGVVAARAIVSHRIPEGTVYMHHAQERTVGTPVAETSGKRGGIHNSLTRILIKPSHLIGGYAQHSYAFNYTGPTGNQRDEVTVIRRRSQEVEF
ncbi:nitrate reductase subunit alpha [Corynebacterium sphenisci]|uniref:nitrate reductase subunit alpha n=1 Tax=Corynebacterium sphenisci TaxID=191493 RepID=UPI0026DF2B1F|nr:nitrate reductase subunit alpha [Corynebacterium sphenisci]MDO5730347.1 nitrate reductase subunit alpha [Corynebacterium sphenisci]